MEVWSQSGLVMRRYVTERGDDKAVKKLVLAAQDYVMVAEHLIRR
jgi:hypothetical protein